MITLVARRYKSQFLLCPHAHYRIAQIRELSLYNAQLVMVGNKVDLTESRTVTREQAEELAQSLGVEYYETSAKDGVGVNEVFERLVILISEKITEDTKS